MRGREENLDGRAPVGDHRRRRWSPAATWVAGVLSVALVATACGGGVDGLAAPPADAATGPTTTTAAPTTTTTTAAAPTPEQEVEAKYREFWEARLLATDPPNPNAPQIDATMAGEQRDSFRATLSDLAEQAQVVRLPPDSLYSARWVQASVSGGVAEIEACVVDDAIVSMTGANVGLDIEVVLNDDVVSRLTWATAQRLEDGWRITSHTFGERVEGPTACDR